MSRIIRRLKWWLPLVAIASCALAAIRYWPRPPLSQSVPLSLAVEDRHGRLLRLATAADQRYRLWVPLHGMSPTLVEAVLLQEDAWFRRHPGFNPVSLARGAWSTYSGHARIGGSTITMQLARLRWRLDTRTPRGKLVQVLRAAELETTYSKDDILEAYLNLAPYGGNIEGVGAASRIYFRKPVAQLTLPEALTLAVLPQAPSRRGRLHRRGEEGEYAGAGLEAARRRLYARWRMQYGSDPAQDALMRLPLRLRGPRELPFAAPHLVDRVLAERSWHPTDGATLRTTLDARLQRLLEERVRNHLARNRERGLRNATAMLVDTRDMGVRARVGAAG